MRQVLWSELEHHQLYPLLSHAFTFPYDYNKKCSPVTRDGKYVSKAAIYNISSWGNWKSASIGESERKVAALIDRLPILELMELNKGRKSTDAALFPDGELLPVNVDDLDLQVRG